MEFLRSAQKAIPALISQLIQLFAKQVTTAPMLFLQHAQLTSTAQREFQDTCHAHQESTQLEEPASLLALHAQQDLIASQPTLPRLLPLVMLVMLALEEPQLQTQPA